MIERLDDASFIAPLKTACGSFHVYVALGGKQRVTSMAIHRTQ